MALLPIDELFASQTVEQVKASLLSIWGALDLAVTAWQKMGKARTIWAVVSEALSGYTVGSSVAVKGGFLDTSEGEWLKILAKYVYNVDAIEKQSGEAPLELVNSGSTAYGPYAVGALHFANSATKKTYNNSEAIPLNGIAASGTTTIYIVADEAGTESNASPGDIDTIVSPALLGVTCSNPIALVGVDDEAPEDLRARCRAKLGSLSPDGPKFAYEYVAKTPSLVGGVVVTRVSVIGDNATGEIEVVIAGSSGALGIGDVSSVNTGLQEWAVPNAVTLTTSSAVNVPIDITYSLWVYTSVGMTTSEIEDLVEEELIDFIKRLPIGGAKKTSGGSGAVWVDTLKGVIQRAGYVNEQEQGIAPHVVTASVSLPASDTTMLYNRVAVPGTITATVTLVTPP